MAKQNGKTIQSKQNKGVIYAIFLIFGFLLYGNTISHDYALDDAIVITQNVFTQQGIQGVDEIFKYDSFVGFWMNSYSGRTAEQIQEEKKLVAGGRYRPFSIATFAIEKDLFGDKPAVHHIINILIYILTAILLYKVLIALFPLENSQTILNFPLLAVLLFMAHPIHSEAVANIKGRDELLTLLGALLAAWAYLKYLDKKAIKYLVIAFFAMFFGLLSKEITITWLAVIPVGAWFFKEKSLKKHVRPFVSILIPTIIFLLIRQSVLGWGIGEKQIAQELMNNPFLAAEGSERIGTILFTLFMYLRLLIFPHPLTYDYYPYHIPLTEVDSFIPIAMLVLYAGMLIYMFYVMYRYARKTASFSIRMWAFVLILYLAPLSVVSNLFFPVGVFMAERFVYFSSLGFVLLLAWGMFDALPNRFPAKAVKTFSLVFLFIVIGLYSGKTIARNTAWKNDFVLFTTDVKTSVNSAKANTTAGGKLLERAKLLNDKSSKDYDPQLADEYVDLAITYLNRALEIHPAYVDPMLLLGNAHYQKNRNIAEAVKWYAEILKIRPYHELAVKNTRLILPQIVGLFADERTPNTADEIIAACEKFDSVKPGVPEVYRIMGLMYARYKGDFKTAIPYYEKALEVNPNDADAWKDLGVIYGQSNQFEQALQAFKKVVEINPEDAQAMFNIAVTYQNLGDVDSANQWFAKYKAQDDKN
jgi:tetratricopeptide (TPR) repeat protein